MKFAEKLTAHLTPEWRKQYIDYDELKEFLYKSIQDIDRTEDWTEDIIAHLDACDVQFFEQCRNALQKIDVFFNEKLAEAIRKYAGLTEELDDFLQSESTKTTFFGGSRLSLSRRYNESSRRSFGENADPKTKENGAVRVKLNAIELEEKRESEDGLRRRRSQASTAVERKIAKTSSKKEKKTFRKLHDLKLAFSEFYLSLVLLQNYQTLNFTGFRKILKKHDKLFRRDNGLQWRQQNVDNAKFNTSREVDDLIAKVENEYTEKLEQGDRQRAMKRLRVPPLSERHNPTAVFRFGFFAGIFVVQSIVIILACLFLRPLPKYYLPALRIFRATFLIIFFLCLFGLNTYGWRSSGVNNVLIFELNPRSHLDHFQLLEASFFLATIWGCAVIYFLFSAILHIPSYASPFALVVFMLLCLLNPFKFGYYRARLWLLRILGRILRAPLCRVTFPDFWLADQLNSLNFILPDFASFVCFYSSQISWSNELNYLPLTVPSNLTDVSQSTLPLCALRSDVFISESCQCAGVLFGLDPILRTLPAWFRFAQCLRRYHDMDVKKLNPHVLNAGKYSTTFFIAASLLWIKFSPSVPALVFLTLSSLVHSTYTYSWDILMDWGLMECHSDNRMLRDELVYRYKAYYYIAIIEDLILRFTWIIRFTITHTKQDQVELVVTILTAAEVVRRFIWNFFRLENEHLNNCGEFRAVRDIFITPLPKRPPRSVSAQVFSTSNGPQQKHNTIYPTNNSALYGVYENAPKSKHGPKSVPTMAVKDEQSANADTLYSSSHDRDLDNNSNMNQSKARRILTRISEATFKTLPYLTSSRTTQTPSHRRHYHNQHHIMDNADLVEELRAIKSQLSQQAENTSHQTDSPSTELISQPKDDCSFEHSELVGETKSDGSAAHISHQCKSPNIDGTKQASRGSDRLCVLPTVHWTPSIRIVRSQSHNDLNSAALSGTCHPLQHRTVDSSSATISSMESEARRIHPNDTAITLLSQDPDRMGGSVTSVNAYSLLIPASGQRPRFVATSNSSLESPDLENSDSLIIEGGRRLSVRQSSLRDQPNNSHSTELVQNGHLSITPNNPRIIRIQSNSNKHPNEEPHVHAKP